MLYMVISRVKTLITSSWPAHFSTKRAEKLGLQPDISLREIVESFARSLKDSQP
jgi:hypothetical protein